MTIVTGPVVLRPLVLSDIDQVVAMTRAVGVFREDEIPVAIEVFQAAAAGNDTYEGCAAERDGRLAGWASWGPVPCTLGTFDLYWIVVDPVFQGQGIGTLLLGAMEERVRGRARLIVVETAGRADYAATRAFYEKQGYRVVSRIPDFYEPGDDRVTYVKTLAMDR